jgi:hypothetical protein
MLVRKYSNYNYDNIHTHIDTHTQPEDPEIS